MTIRAAALPLSSQTAIMSRHLPRPSRSPPRAPGPGPTLALIAVCLFACGDGADVRPKPAAAGSGGAAAASGSTVNPPSGAGGTAVAPIGGAGADAGADSSAGASAARDAMVLDASPGAADSGVPEMGCSFGADTSLVELSPALFSAGGKPADGPECSEVITPERGLFVFRDLRSPGNLGGLRADGFALVYGKVLIDDYRERDLDAALLEQLAAGFAAVRRAGLKVLPRVYYADDGEAPDAPLARVLAHIEQLTPLLRENADVIAVLHPGFVGAWGEWHSSSNRLTEPAARKQIFDALLAALPEGRMTLSRRPSFKQEAYGGPLDEASMFDGSARARVGHLNDCFLASDDDVGTYQRPGERDYAVADSAFVPVGGETCGVYPARSECAPALAEMALLHWSFLNTSYHPDVIAGFRSGGCYQTIACRLGYRFALLRHESPQVLAAGSTVALRIRVVNDGFARMYNPRPLELVLDGPVRRVLPVDGDPRRWGPGEPHDLCLASALPADLPAGEYRLGIRLPDAAPSLRDDARYAVRIANAAAWDADTGTNLLDARVSVER